MTSTAFHPLNSCASHDITHDFAGSALTAWLHLLAASLLASPVCSARNVAFDIFKVVHAHIAERRGTLAAGKSQTCHLGCDCPKDTPWCLRGSGTCARSALLKPTRPIYFVRVPLSNTIMCLLKLSVKLVVIGLCALLCAPEQGEPT